VSEASTWQKIAGFEATGYAMWRGRLVWAGDNVHTDHPRNAHKPWHAEPVRCDAASLRAGAEQCLALLDRLPSKGLLAWLTNHPLPFPMDRAAPRFDALRRALEQNHLRGFETAALRVLGLGVGLTPSGDDFLGGICFALKHAPRQAWQARFPAVLTRIRAAAATSTNVISAALLDDLIDGSSYRAAHELLAALQGNAAPRIEAAARSLMGVGASSGADMLAGILIALLTTPDDDTETSP
jgi:Protein of unknown function (DUF2877)